MKGMFSKWVFLLMVSAGAGTARAQFEYLAENGQATITRYVGDESVVVVPARIDELPVTKIGSEAFRARPVTSVTLPFSVRTIGAMAFLDCAQLTSITLPPGLLEIQEAAFAGCAALTSISLPDGLTVIWNATFIGCRALESIVIPNNVRQIGGSAFLGCVNLRNLTLSSNLEGIGGQAFDGCASLTSVALPNGLQRVFHSAFAGTRLGEVTIPDSVRILAPGAFGGIATLTSVDVPASVLELDRAFAACVALQAINVDPANPNYTSNDGVLFNKAQTRLIDYPAGKPGPYEIPGSVREIGGGAFAAAAALRELTIPPTVISMETSVFSGSSLRSVTISAPISRLPGGIFVDCRDLLSVDLPEGIEVIEGWAFERCRSLRTLTIPSTVREVGYWAFAFCPELKAVLFKGDYPALNESFPYLYSSVPLVFYLPGAQGWANTIPGVTVQPWNPGISTSDSQFGIVDGAFQMRITGAPGTPAVIQAASLQLDDWRDVANITLPEEGALYQENQPASPSSGRIFRIRFP